MNVTIDEIVRDGNRYKRARIGSFDVDDAGANALNYNEIVINHDITKKPRTVRVKLIRPITVALVGGLSIGVLVDVMARDTEISGSDGNGIGDGGSYRTWATNHDVLDPR